MSAKKKKQQRFNYSKESVSLALQEISMGKKFSETSRKYNIPELTLRAKKLGIYANKKPGPAPVITTEEEKGLVNWIFHCCNKGFPISKLQLFECVKVICEKLNKPNPFINNTPQRSWYEGFKKRNPEVSERVSENVTISRARVTESSLRKWFDEVNQYLIEENLISIEANRIFNCDETGMINTYYFNILLLLYTV